MSLFLYWWKLNGTAMDRDNDVMCTCGTGLNMHLTKTQPGLGIKHWSPDFGLSNHITNHNHIEISCMNWFVFHSNRLSNQDQVKTCFKNIMQLYADLWVFFNIQHHLLHPIYFRPVIIASIGIIRCLMGEVQGCKLWTITGLDIKVVFIVDSMFWCNRKRIWWKEKKNLKDMTCI